MPPENMDLSTIKAPALDLAEQGETYSAIAEKLGIARSTLLKIRREDPQFRQMLDDSMLAGSTIVLEELRQVPYKEESPQRARVQIEALCRYLELRWPHRYGKQLNVNVKVLDMRSALDKARARVSSQIIDMQLGSDGTYAADPASQAVQAAVLDDLL